MKKMLDDVSYVFLGILTGVIYAIGVFILFITCPLWIIPYYIIKNKGGKSE